MMKAAMRHLVVIVILLGLSLVLLLPRLPQAGRPAERVAARIAVAQVPYTSALWLAKERGYFSDEGIELTLLPSSSGSQALSAMRRGDCEFATASELTITSALLERDPLRVLATISASIDTLELIARRDLVVARGEDLVHRRIGIIPGGASQSFLDTYLEFNGLTPAMVEQVPLTQEGLLPALREGKVDAISAWMPTSLQAIDEFGDEIAILRAGMIFRWSWNLLARDGEVAGSPQAMRILRATLRATMDIAADPLRAARILEPVLGTSQTHLLETWKRTTFELALDQALLLNLELQARRAMDAAGSAQGELPNFLEVIDARALRAIDPWLVSVIDGKDAF
jgi:NitT/TauT family transport system substrate-binding protein